MIGYHWKHRLSNIDETNETATCAFCGPNSKIRFRKTTDRWVCRGQGKGKHNKSTWYKSKKEKVDKQFGLCAICGKDKELVLDHCHRRKLIRAALCRSCNNGLGLFHDNPVALRKAAEYLEKFSKTEL